MWPAKHSYAWLPRKCDFWTGRHMDRQTPDKVIPMCRYASQATQKKPFKLKVTKKQVFHGTHVPLAKAKCDRRTDGRTKWSLCAALLWHHKRSWYKEKDFIRRIKLLKYAKFRQRKNGNSIYYDLKMMRNCNRLTVLIIATNLPNITIYRDFFALIYFSPSSRPPWNHQKQTQRKINPTIHIHWESLKWRKYDSLKNFCQDFPTQKIPNIRYSLCFSFLRTNTNRTYDLLLITCLPCHQIHCQSWRTLKTWQTAPRR